VRGGASLVWGLGVTEPGWLIENSFTAVALSRQNSILSREIDSSK